MPGLIRCTNPHTVTVLGTTASTQHPPPGGGFGFGVKRKAHGAWGLGGPPRPLPPAINQPVSRVTASSARAWQCPSGRIAPCSAEGIGPRKGKGRAEEAPPPLPSLLPRLISPLVGSPRPKILIPEACGAGACFLLLALLHVAFSTIWFAPSSG
jgi:hypothetical protein